MDEYEVRGILHICLWLEFKPLNGVVSGGQMQIKGKRVILETHRYVTHQQARGLMEDFRGQNSANTVLLPRGVVEGIWKAEDML